MVAKRVPVSMQPQQNVALQHIIGRRMSIKWQMRFVREFNGHVLGGVRQSGSVRAVREMSVLLKYWRHPTPLIVSFQPPIASSVYPDSQCPRRFDLSSLLTT